MNLAEELVDVMRQLPYPVTIVTAAAEERMRGITIGSFASLSMEPPLISFNVEADSRMHGLMEQVDSFVVHVAGPGQEDLCTRFSLPDMEDGEQFEGVPFHRQKGESPVLEGVIAEIHCRLHHRFVAGDHSIVIGRVERVVRHRDESAILYLGGEYRSL